MEESKSTPDLTTRAVGTRYGVIFGAISIVYFLIFTLLEVDMSSGFARWGTTLISIVIIFLAHKYFKDNGDGFMAYGQGLGIAFWIALIASALSSVFTYIYIKFIDTGYIDMIRQKSIEQMEAQGQSEEQIEVAMKFVNMFTSAEALLGIGLIFGVIILMVVSLIITIFTQKPQPESSI